MKIATEMSRILLAGILCVISVTSVYAHTNQAEYNAAFAHERQMMEISCRKAKERLIDDYASWILPKLEQREQKSWSYTPRTSSRLQSYTCRSAASCDSILGGLSRCDRQLSSCVSSIPKSSSQSCSVLFCYEEKVQCMGPIIDDYISCVGRVAR